MDSKIAQAKQEAKDAAVQDAKKEIADEKKVIQENIKTAKEEAVAVAANDAAANFVKTKDIDSKVNAVLVTKPFLTADSETLKDFVKTKDFTEETTKIQKDIENAKTAAKDETIAIVDKNFVTNVDKVLETKQFLTVEDSTDFVKSKDFSEEKEKIIETVRKEAIDYSDNATGKLWDSLTKDYVTKEGDLKDLVSRVDKNEQNIKTTGIALEAYAKISDLDKYASKKEVEAAAEKAKEEANEYTNDKDANLRAQVNANTNNFANYATKQEAEAAATDAKNDAIATVNTTLTSTYATKQEATAAANNAKDEAIATVNTTLTSTYATKASLGAIETDVGTIVGVLATATDESIANNTQLTGLKTNYNISVSNAPANYDAGDDIQKP